MFSLAFSYLLAEHLGVRLVAMPLPEFPNTYKAIRATESRPSINTIEESVTDTTESFDEIVDRCRGNLVLTQGWFERAEWYVPHRQKLRDFFGVQPETGSDIVFQFRGGDFKGSKKEVELLYYVNAWELLCRPTNARVCCDESGYETLKSFCRVTGIPQPTSNDPESDFKTMLNAKELVVSRSTFAWWAAFLSGANVIQPKYDEEWVCGNHVVPEWIQM